MLAIKNDLLYSKTSRKLNKMRRNQSSVGVYNHMKLSSKQKSQSLATHSLIVPPSIKSKVSITIFSNYGDSEIIACSEIAFFSKTGKRISISKIICEPEPDSKENLNRLVSGSMIKTGDEKMWEHKWPLPRNLPMKITFYFATDDELDNIRIWQPVDEKKGIKKIEVTLDFQPFWEGELNSSFSTTIRHHQSSISKEKSLDGLFISQFVPESLLAQEKPLHPITFHDKFGKYPIKPFKELKIVLLDTHDHTQVIILQSILLFDLEGNLILLDEIDNIELINGKSKESPKVLFPGKNEEPNHVKDLYSGWMCEKDGEKPPELVLSFNMFTCISAISLINPISITNQINISLKNFSIYADNRRIYTGTICNRVESESHGNEFRRTIYFIDSPSIQQKISSIVTKPDIFKTIDSFYNTLF